MALDVEAINPVRLGLFPPNLLFIFARWEVACGFCRTRFRRTVQVGAAMTGIDFACG